MSKNEILIMISGIIVSFIVGLVSYITGFTRGYNTYMDVERRLTKGGSEEQEEK